MRLDEVATSTDWPTCLASTPLRPAFWRSMVIGTVGIVQRLLDLHVAQDGDLVQLGQRPWSAWPRAADRFGAGDDDLDGRRASRSS